MKKIISLIITLLILLNFSACAKPQNNNPTESTTSIEANEVMAVANTKSAPKKETLNLKSEDNPKPKANATSSQKQDVSETKSEKLKPQETKTERPRPFKELEEEIITLLNAERAKEGLKPLIAENTYYDYALTRTAECIEYWSHTRPNGKDWTSLYFEDNTIKDIQLIAENLGKKFSSAEIIVNALMNSEGHRKNIMHEKFTHVCVAVAEMPTEEGIEKQLYAVTQHFYLKEEK